MKLSTLYSEAVKVGMENDPRGPRGLERVLEQARKTLSDLPQKDKWEFDRESLTNPFSDTRILVGDPDTEVRRMLVGIDISIGEILLADRLREKGQVVDLVLAHHPEGRALADLGAVMGVQADIWRRFGVPIAYGDTLMAGRAAEVDRHLHAANMDQSISAARILDVPFMCCHTPADNSVNTFLQKSCDELDEDATLEDIMDMLKEIPEYREAVGQGVGPTIFQGEPTYRAGKVMVDMTGGTSGPEEAIQRLAAAGVGTILGMHMSEEHRKKAEEAHINVVIAGHHASDSLGMNLVIDRLESAGVDVVSCSSFSRVSRTQ
ncbi:MAG: NGG1p interacting factor NIF3 [Actinobacteria bacterium]|nr:NGG1p interacting factor NIF3 [Actinomycetota bacterium]